MVTSDKTPERIHFLEIIKASYEPMFEVVLPGQGSGLDLSPQSALFRHSLAYFIVVQNLASPDNFGKASIDKET